MAGQANRRAILKAVVTAKLVWQDMIELDAATKRGVAAVFRFMPIESARGFTQQARTLQCLSASGAGELVSHAAISASLAEKMTPCSAPKAMINSMSCENSSLVMSEVRIPRGT